MIVKEILFFSLRFWANKFKRSCDELSKTEGWKWPKHTDIKITGASFTSPPGQWSQADTDNGDDEETKDTAVGF